MMKDFRTIILLIIFFLFSQMNTTEFVVINIGDEKLNLETLENDKSTWFCNLTHKVKDLKNTKKQFYLVSSSIPVQGFDYFVRKFRKQPLMQNVHFLFNFSQSEEDFKQAFNKNLTVSILKNGKHYTMIRQSVKYKKEENSSFTPKNADQRKRIQYFSLNLWDETADETICNNKVGNIDYSGYDENMKRVMGLAQIDDCGQNRIDPIFAWEVPEIWSLFDAATITHAYLSVSILQLTRSTFILTHCGKIKLSCSTL